MANVVIERFTSKALKGNPLGDSVERELPVYLPPSYDSKKRARFPVVYMLAGFTGSGKSFLNFQAYGENLPQKLDRLIGAGEMGEMIVVMPDCYTKIGGSQYINSAAIGRYEDHVMREIVPLVDRKFRTLADREHRGVMGKSSGGYGAMVLAMRHADAFGAAATHSGDCAFELCYQPDFAKFVTEMGRYKTLEKFQAEFERAPHKESKHVMMMNVLAMAAAYSPNLRCKPFRADLPFDLETAELVPEVWQRWLANDPVRLAAGHAKALRSLKLFFIDCGTRDEFNIHLGARILARRLDELKIAHEREEFDAGHFNITHRYDVSLPKLAAALAAEPGQLLRYRPTPPLAYRLADLERVERQVRASASGPLPKAEVHTYRTDKRYRWQVVDRKDGLAVKLDVVSSRMAMDGTTVPKDLGGHSGEDWIDERGNVQRLGPVEDPIRPEASLPSGRVQPGDSWAEQLRAGEGLPAITHDVRFVELRNVAGTQCVRLEVKADGDGVDAKRGARVVTRTHADVDLDPVRGVVVAADIKVRLEETIPATGEALSRVVRVTRRKVVLEGESR